MLVFPFPFVHAYTQGNGHPPILVAESLPLGEDHTDTIPYPVPAEEWAQQCQLENETKLDQQVKIKGDDKVGEQVSFPEIPPHKPIVRRAQFHAKNVIKEEKAKKKSEKESASKGAGKKSKQQKSKSKKGAKQSKLRNSKRRAARKAKAKRTSIASKKRSNDMPEEQEQPVPQVPKVEKQADEVEVGTKGNKNKGKSKQHATLKHAQVQEGSKVDEEKSEVKSTQKKRKSSPNKQTSKEKDTPKEKAKAKAKAKAKSKGSKGKTNKSKPAAAHPGENDALCPEIVTMLVEAKEKAKKMYTQCYVEGHPGCVCDHMEQEVPHYDDFSLSVYWTRRAVGVKMLDEQLPASQRKSKSTWQQVGYFAGGTCPYVNIMLADYWVLSSKQVTFVNAST